MITKNTENFEEFCVGNPYYPECAKIEQNHGITYIVIGGIVIILSAVIIEKTLKWLYDKFSKKA
ncbi:hypothetical protein A2662_01050 [Candidatus Giovannonibacteria bacterium RIFCSPHIGHO2_01_FULL_45_33]|uniref:Uncharacterized protein n=1 Tax=Candidatus Giovannonibacteria bacterium RIFCSPLOWO2_01_FULL_45_34 TaxID=1798351 RepID=A0A1F5WZY2_9BACT|nr:MAG: hypothetical protein A2662_01050 [Candidatus Giovannonibacteria bacterium RIFCSPHIGHO2_01_FULL_45_33]OGF81200.1 MAG: hypothetical protein A2930_00375 [Candidatus Giovannonibacteria bacterium RIFCSPLOWO2_01_FULL_45_34]